MDLLAALPHATARVRLRRLRATDLDALHGWRGSAEVARLQGWAPMSRDAVRDLLRAETGAEGLRAGGWRQIGMALATTDVLVGDIGVYLAADAQSAEFGLSVDPRQQGQGLATEAAEALLAQLFRHTGVGAVTAATDVRNLACLRLLTKLGMREREVREIECKGEHCVEKVFELRRPELRAGE